MKKNIALTILMILSCHVAVAQVRPVIDSLRRELSIATHDSTRAFAMAELCFQYRVTSPDSSLQYGTAGLKLARKIQHKRAEAQALSNLAFVFRDLGNLPDALNYQLKALKISEDNHYDLEAGLSMIRVSAIYRDLADYSKSLDYLRRSFEKHKKANNLRGIILGYLNLSTTYLDMNQLDSAGFYAEKASPLIDSLKLTDLYPNIAMAQGDVQKKLGNIQHALKFYRQGISSTLNLKFPNLRNLALTNTRIAEVYKEMNQPDSCVFYARQSLALAQDISNRAGIVDAASLLSTIYEPIDLKQSYYYFKIATAAKDSLFNRNKFNAIQSMTFEKEELDRSLALEKKTYWNRVRLYLSISGAAVFLVTALILYRNNRQKQRANFSLQKTLTDLKITQNQLIQSEKMASLGELTAGIAHEIQNPLNFVNNFSEVNKELIGELKAEIEKGNYDEVKALANDVAENEEKINHHGKRADAIVKGMLQHSRSSSGVKEPTDINALADEYLRLAYHGLRAKDKSFNALLKTEFDGSIGNINIVPQDIGRVILNLITNAFYAVAEKKKQSDDSYEPTVLVSTKKTNGSVTIAVRDNGKGIPPKVVDKIFQPFFTTKPTGQGTGLGLSLSYDIVKAHGGEIKVDTEEGTFSEFVIQLVSH